MVSRKQYLLAEQYDETRIADDSTACSSQMFFCSEAQPSSKTYVQRCVLTGRQNTKVVFDSCSGLYLLNVLVFSSIPTDRLCPTFLARKQRTTNNSGMRCSKIPALSMRWVLSFGLYLMSRQGKPVSKTKTDKLQVKMYLLFRPGSFFHI